MSDWFQEAKDYFDYDRDRRRGDGVTMIEDKVHAGRLIDEVERLRGVEKRQWMENKRIANDSRIWKRRAEKWFEIAKCGMRNLTEPKGGHKIEDVDDDN